MDANDGRRWFSTSSLPSTNLCVVSAGIRQKIGENAFPDDSLKPCNTCRIIFIDENLGAWSFGLDDRTLIIGTNVPECVNFQKVFVQKSSLIWVRKAAMDKPHKISAVIF